MSAKPLPRGTASSRWGAVNRRSDSNHTLVLVCPDPDLVGLVQSLVSRPIIGEQRSSGLGLHQGAGLSPVLANLYLDPFDRRMMTLGYQVIRYGDDIAIPVADRPSGERALESLTRQVQGPRPASQVRDYRPD